MRQLPFFSPKTQSGLVLILAEYVLFPISSKKAMHSKFSVKHVYFSGSWRRCQAAHAN